jgi:hypothetical protein
VGAAEPGIPPEPDLPDDLRHDHRPRTGTRTQVVTHTRPVTCDFTMPTAHWAKSLECWQAAGSASRSDRCAKCTGDSAGRRHDSRDQPACGAAE